MAGTTLGLQTYGLYRQRLLSEAEHAPRPVRLVAVLLLGATRQLLALRSKARVCTGRSCSCEAAQLLAQRIKASLPAAAAVRKSKKLSTPDRGWTNRPVQTGRRRGFGL